MYNKVPPPAIGTYQGRIHAKEPTYPPFNPPLGRQPDVRQMNYGDTDNHYEASPAYKSPMYQQSPILRDSEAKPYGYTAIEERKSDSRGVSSSLSSCNNVIFLQNGVPLSNREAEDAISKLPPHLRPPHGIPPPHLRHLFPNLAVNNPSAVPELPPRDPAPRRDDSGFVNVYFPF